MFSVHQIASVASHKQYMHSTVIPAMRVSAPHPHGAPLSAHIKLHSLHYCLMPILKVINQYPSTCDLYLKSIPIPVQAWRPAGMPKTHLTPKSSASSPRGSPSPYADVPSRLMAHMGAHGSPCGPMRVSTPAHSVPQVCK